MPDQTMLEYQTAEAEPLTEVSDDIDMKDVV
jgi:hypothetical protein